MSGGRGVAKILMRCAAFLAPRSKAEWIHAMRAEFEAAGDAQALSWAAGCVGTSLLWRARAEAIYVVALVTAVMAYEPFIIFTIENVIGEHAPAEYLFPATHATEQGYLALATFVLCIYRPRRLVLTTVLVPLCVEIIPFAASVWRAEQTVWDIGERVRWTYWFTEGVAVYICWPVIPAALLAFGLNWWMRASRRRIG